MPPKVTGVRFPDYDDLDESDMEYLARQNMAAQNMAVVAEALRELEVETPSARERRESAARRAYAKKLAEDKQRDDKASDQAGRLAALEQKADAMQTATRVGQPYGGQEPLKPKRSMLSSKDSKAMADEEEEE